MTLHFILFQNQCSSSFFITLLTYTHSLRFLFEVLPSVAPCESQSECQSLCAVLLLRLLCLLLSLLRQYVRFTVGKEDLCPHPVLHLRLCLFNPTNSGLSFELRLNGSPPHPLSFPLSLPTRRSVSSPLSTTLLSFGSVVDVSDDFRCSRVDSERQDLTCKCLNLLLRNFLGCPELHRENTSC